MNPDRGNELFIYLDNNATTRIDPRVLEAIMPFLTDRFANASSTHAFGLEANEAVKTARKQVADLISAEAHEVVFTAGATEAINIALKGVVGSSQSAPKHVITVCTEHSAMLDTSKFLQAQGVEVTFLRVQADGLLDLRELEREMRKETALVSVMFANNEIGVIQPIKEIAKITHEAGALFMTDATQAVGKIPIDVSELEIDLMSFSGHKIYAPKGIGALYIRSGGSRKVRLSTLIHGGGHERGLRSGTLNVPGIVGIGKACEICGADMKSDSTRIGKLRDALEAGLLSIDDTFVNGHPRQRMFNVTNICFRNADSEAVILGLKNIAVSNGSACTSTSMEPSHVLKAIGLSDKEAYSSIRFSLGRFNDREEIETVVIEMDRVVQKLRRMS